MILLCQMVKLKIIPDVIIWQDNQGYIHLLKIKALISKSNRYLFFLSRCYKQQILKEKALVGWRGGVGVG